MYFVVSYTQAINSGNEIVEEERNSNSNTRKKNETMYCITSSISIIDEAMGSVYRGSI
jgi:hypothetical protein